MNTELNAKQTLHWYVIGGGTEVSRCVAAPPSPQKAALPQRWLALTQPPNKFFFELISCKLHPQF